MSKSEEQVRTQKKGQETFVAPRLERLGTLRELTRGGGAKQLPDPGGGLTRP